MNTITSLDSLISNFDTDRHSSKIKRKCWRRRQRKKRNKNRTKKRRPPRITKFTLITITPPTIYPPSIPIHKIYPIKVPPCLINMLSTTNATRPTKPPIKSQSRIGKHIHADVKSIESNVKSIAQKVQCIESKAKVCKSPPMEKYNTQCDDEHQPSKQQKFAVSIFSILLTFIVVLVTLTHVLFPQTISTVSAQNESGDVTIQNPELLACYLSDKFTILSNDDLACDINT
eukprot:165725_1